MMKLQFTPLLLVLSGLFGQIHADQVRGIAQPAGLEHGEHKDHKVYGSFYTEEECTIAPKQAIPFDKVQVESKHGIEHRCGTGDFSLSHPGIYRVIYSVSAKDCHHGVVALELDGYVIPGSEISVGDDLVTLTSLIEVCGKSCCDHKLRLINNYPGCDDWYTHNIKLKSKNCGSVTAAIDIERIDECHPDCCCRK